MGENRKVNDPVKTYGDNSVLSLDENQTKLDTTHESIQLKFRK